MRSLDILQNISKSFFQKYKYRIQLGMIPSLLNQACVWESGICGLIEWVDVEKDDPGLRKEGNKKQ